MSISHSYPILMWTSYELWSIETDILGNICLDSSLAWKCAATSSFCDVILSERWVQAVESLCENADEPLV
jgi:hypothetical protein